jgi:hypothetical protein
MAKKKISEEEWKAANVKPEIPLDVQQSIKPPTEPEPEPEKAEEEPEPAED